tara:strand:+ start:1714 stop:2292 length:579 start_codon:yes stop_codon:yes gene_type:complete
MSLKSNYESQKNAVLEIRSAQGGDAIKFPAFLTAFTNAFQSSWNEEQVYGRIDPIGTFQSTKRSINIGFDIIAYDEMAAKINIKNINAVSAMLYPSYSDASGNALVLSKAPLVEIKFGNLIQDGGSKDNFLLGWIGSWSANPVLDMGMFTPEPGMFLPKVYNATLDFVPQHRGDLAFQAFNATKITFPYDGG